MNSQQVPQEVIHTVVHRNAVTSRGMRNAFILGMLVLIASIPGLFWGLGVRFPWPQGPTLPSITGVRLMSDLVTANAKTSFQYEGWNNLYTVTWLIHSEVVLGVDMSKVNYAKSDPEKRTATIVLPQPHIVMSKIDHDQSRLLTVEERFYGASWVGSAENVKAAVWRNAERSAREHDKTEENLQKARDQAESVLTKFFDKAGWKLEVKWEGPPLLASVGSMAVVQ